MAAPQPIAGGKVRGTTKDTNHTKESHGSRSDVRELSCLSGPTDKGVDLSRLPPRWGSSPSGVDQNQRGKKVKRIRHDAGLSPLSDGGCRFNSATEFISVDSGFCTTKNTDEM